MNAPLYTTEILRLAASLSDPVVFGRVDGRAERRSPTCGSRVTTEVQVDSAGRLTAMSQQVHACAFGQASAALVQRSALAKDRGDIAAALTQLEGWLSGVSDNPGDWPGMAALGPARSRKSRHGAILLPFRALLAAIDAAR